MIPIPADIAALWSHGWHPDAHPERPWWCGTDTFNPCLLRRLDGGQPFVGESSIASYDEAHPLPEPPILPGQVWVWPEGTHIRESAVHADIPPGGSAQVLSVLHGRPVFVVVNTSILPSPPALICGPLGPPPGAILVAGPTPWGRNVPWSPVSLRLSPSDSVLSASTVG
jgi:hypothetical protein